VVAYLQNQDGTHSFSLYLLCGKIMLLCDSLQTVLTVTHVPGNHNLIADALSRFRVPVNMEWELHPVIFQAITLIWDRPLMDRFANILNYKLDTFVSPIPDQTRKLGRWMQWTSPGKVCSITSSHHSSSPQEFAQYKRGWLQDYSYSSSLAKTILVTGSPTIIVCKTASSSLERGSLVSIQGKEASSRPG
jgi:hypothetical protein